MVNSMTSNEIRQGFLDFFKGKGHSIIPSSSLIPHDDPTLLLTTAGMVQVKPYFLGIAVPPNRRLASCQKCFRTTDIDSVGDAKHLTFFEMLGNFSVGDYFKKEAISWAWEFVTVNLKIPEDKLWITIYLDDEEAFTHWKAIGFPDEKIVRLGEKDNFWGPAGDSGPCGPCSEIHYDFGVDAGCGRPECGPGCDCSRFSEIWNLVFTQYNQDSSGKRTPLPRPNIDTGMGLERTAAVLQGVNSVYDTDLFLPLQARICDVSGKIYGQSEEDDHAIRIIIEHGRGLTFLIADGVLPSNEGRGYVLRRILRKASFFGRKLGIEEPFLNNIAELVINNMGHVYPELVTHQNFVTDIIRTEEEKFISTLDAGINLVERIVNGAVKKGNQVVEGKEIFQLYDTYGFPVDLTAEIAKERGLSIDIDGFEVEMGKQRERARAAHKFSGASLASDNSSERILPDTTNFTGYEELKSNARIVHILDKATGFPLETAAAKQEVAIVLDKTPFYAEMGGQVGDTGRISLVSNNVEVTDTVMSPFGVLGEGAYVHIGRVTSGGISVGDNVEVAVDIARRKDIARNHTATHLLQAALRNVLGKHVQQRGSLVSPERLRFDFSHMKAISSHELSVIQHQVNEMIRHNMSVKGVVLPYSQIGKRIEEGEVIALFGEKYGDSVRVLEIGDPPLSSELCGGTHVDATGEIGFFKIISEASIGTGLRRIEAVTGRGAEAFMEERVDALDKLASELKCSPLEVKNKLASMAAELSAERKKSAKLERELHKNLIGDLLEKKEQIDGITVVTANLGSSSIPVMRETGDLLRDKLKSAVIVLGTVYNDKPGFIAMVTPDLVQRGLHAGNIVKRVAELTGGSGGGKAEMAQAGGKDKTKIDKALKLVKEIIEEKRND
jgi:alanyl-tRNA synthetase